MSGTGDLDLLRRFEPIVRYTHGEFFFPMAVDDYIAECDLWAVDDAGRTSTRSSPPASSRSTTWRPGGRACRIAPSSCGSSSSR